MKYTFKTWFIGFFLLGNKADSQRKRCFKEKSE